MHLILQIALPSALAVVVIGCSTTGPSTRDAAMSSDDAAVLDAVSSDAASSDAPTSDAPTSDAPTCSCRTGSYHASGMMGAGFAVDCAAFLQRDQRMQATRV